MLVDHMDDRVGNAYFAWPERAYLIAADGRVIYRSNPGPDHGMWVGLEQAIRTTLVRGS